MDKTINLDDILNFTAHAESYVRVGIVKAIMYQMGTEELDKLKSILSHAHGRFEAKKRRWKGKESAVSNVRGMVALERSMIALPSVPDHFEFLHLSKQPGWWKRFKKSQFVALDVECVQHNDFQGPFKDKAAIVSIVDHKGVGHTERITWPATKITINSATIKINGITYESLAEGRQFKDVQGEIRNRIQDKIVITVGGSKDFRSLQLDETEYTTFDLQQFYYRTDPNSQFHLQGMSLRDMYFYHFSKDCQSGTHSALEDATNTMQVFMEGYVTSENFDSFWNPDGSRLVCFDDVPNLKAMEKRGMLWSEASKRFIPK